MGKIFITFSLSIRLKFCKKVQKEDRLYFLVSIFSEPEVETVTRGTSYKFALLNQSISRSLWEILYNSSLVNPIWIRLVALERGHRGLLQVTISELDDPKVQRYIRSNIKLLQSEKRCVDSFKFLLKIGLKFYFEGIKRAQQRIIIGN